MKSSNIRCIIECVLFGLVSTTLALYALEIPTAANTGLNTPAIGGGILDLLLITALALPGHQGLTRIIPSDRHWQRTLLLLLSLVPPVGAFLIALASHVFWAETGNKLSVGILIYAVSNFGSLEGMSPAYLAAGALQICVITILFIALAIYVRRVGARTYRLLLALPFLLAVPVLAGNIINRPIAEDSWYQRGHLAFLVSSMLTTNPPARPGTLRGAYPEIYRRPHITAVERKPNILILILESVRAQSVGPQADGRPSLTPFLDSLAARSLNAQAAYTSTDHTSKALVGILCGMHPSPDHASFEALTGGMKPRCLASLLVEQGYNSLFLQSAPGAFEQRWALTANMGYGAIKAQADLNQAQYSKIGYLGMDDQAMVDPAIEWMQAQTKPFLLTMLTTGTHHPYVVPASSGFQGAGTHPKTTKDWLPAYESSIRYNDHVVEVLFEALKRNKLLDNTIVIITGDHGEGFGEHGLYAHNGVPYTEGMQVPLLVHYPDRYPRGGKIPGLRHHLDIVPTVLDFMGARWEGLLPGKSLLSPQGHEQVLSNCWGPQNCVFLRDEAEALAYYYGHRASEHYDLRNDPAQRKPLQFTAAMQRKVDFISQTTGAIKQYWQ